jgi:ATP-dependent DNA helicase PIF1
VDALNQRQLEFLPGESRVYNISTKGRKNKVEQLAKGLLAPQKLELKVGAEVMFVANDFSAGYVNGTRGRVVDFSDEELPLVELYGSNNLIEVEPHNWNLEEDGRKVAEATQLPLRLAWAITIHKSQGMSLDAAEIDLAKTFTPGMGYVALSRVRSLDGIYLRGINNMALQLHEEIFEFDNTLRHASADLALQVTDYIEEKPAKEIEQNEEDFDEQLFSALKNWRLKRAATDSMPAYIIAHDTCLKSIATHRPQTNQQLLGIHGFGPAKLEKYGPEILEITNNAANQGVKI